MLRASECEQLKCVICGHEYKMWCKKDKIEQARDIIDRIEPLISKMANKSQVLAFDKILFMTLIDLLAKEKDFQVQQKVEPIENKTDFDIKLTEQRENLINQFIEILKQIKLELE
jgi:cell division protein ZapA (FtsZ GTPase activity inhibitor)